MIRMLRIELRHNAMVAMLPVVAVLFWFTAYRRAMAMPPLWNMRAASMQMYSVIDLVTPLTGAAAWMGTRESRRRIADTVRITPRDRWQRLLVIWAATAIWAMLGYVACLAVLYGMTARQASWGGPLWWPAAVAAASVPAFTALGFTAGVLAPTRFTAPLVAIAAFFVLALSTEFIGHNANSYWQVTPVVAIDWNMGSNFGVATFYPFLPDLSIAQVMFLTGITVTVLGVLALSTKTGRVVTAAGLTAAVVAVELVGTATLEPHGMIRIPALHDAANDRPIPFTPVCSRTPIPVCLNPAYAGYLPSTTAALTPMLNQIAGLPGAPARVLQEAATYEFDPRAGEEVAPAERNRDKNKVYYLLLPVQLLGPTLTTAQMAGLVRGDSWNIAQDFTDDRPGASQAQDAIAVAIMVASKVHGGHVVFESDGQPGSDPGRSPAMTPGTAANAAATRFAALPAQTRRDWLASHLAALRAGQITLAELP